MAPTESLHGTSGFINNENKDNDVYTGENSETPIKKEYVEINISSGDEPTKRKPILRKFLSPILIAMKVFGLYYEDERKTVWNMVNKVYVYFAFLLLLAMMGWSIAALFYVQHTNGYYSVAIDLVFKFKSIGQAYAMIKICRKKKFWILVSDFGDFLESINICKCEKREGKQRKALWRWIIFFVAFLVICVGMEIVMTIFPTTEYEFFERIRMKPLDVSPGARLLKIFCLVVLLAGWFLPVALCGILSQQMFYLFDEFYRYMKAEKGDIAESKLCVKRFIKEIREKFLRLTELSQQLDSMFNIILMVSYLTDVVLVCFILRLGIYTFTTVWGKLFIFSWLAAPLFSLLALSHNSSKIYDKGQEMSTYVQFFNTSSVTLEAKIEFDMLLFHLGTEPVVMTIWKMIPLYRSIVISIFVSIITYFALIVSLV